MFTAQPKVENKTKTSFNAQYLNKAIDSAKTALINDQQENGYWCYELEADCTIPSEYIIMMHYFGEINEELQKKIAIYIRARQNDDGSWPLYYGGKIDLSCTIKAYWALKLAGDDPSEPHMEKARKIILENGGAAKANVFTRIALAMFGEIPWRGVPFIPVEIMLLPKWFPFHISKVSYWSRTVMIPLFILYSKKAKAKNPKNINLRELFVTPPEKERNYFPVRSRLNRIILGLERIGFRLHPLIPGFIHKKATEKAEKWIIERLNGYSGLGAIFPAMVNAYEALDLLGYPKDHEYMRTAKKAIDLLLVYKEKEIYCQPCVSPVWDTLLATYALQETGDEQINENISKGLDWLQGKQQLEGPGDWKEYRPDLPSGGWPFQFDNDHYPDLDDTAFAGYALQRSSQDKYQENIKRAAEWLNGLQSKNKGFAAFDADNTYYYLNEIPFADHGALLDPPTEDVTARVVMFYGSILHKYPELQDTMDNAVEYLRKKQRNDGSWFGRWGTNFIYGTWSVLIALESAGISKNDPMVTQAKDWLFSKQNEDGGWGETNDSYEDEDLAGKHSSSTSFQTAWALLGLMAAGETHSGKVQRGIEYLLSNQNDDGFWHDPEFTAPGFPRVFYLKYHGYNKYFPLWALARYRNETNQSR